MFYLVYLYKGLDYAIVVQEEISLSKNHYSTNLIGRTSLWMALLYKETKQNKTPSKPNSIFPPTLTFSVLAPNHNFSISEPNSKCKSYSPATTSMEYFKNISNKCI